MIGLTHVALTPSLQQEEEYLIELYPTKEVVNGKYIREYRGHQIFDAGKEFIFVDNSFMISRENIITQMRISSFPIWRVSKEEFDEKKTIEKLIDKVLGERK